MRTTLSRSVLSGIDPNGDIVRQLLSDANIFRNAFNFLFDMDPKHTFVCFDRIGAILMGAATYAGVNSTIWVPDWMNLDTVIARVDPSAKQIIAIVDGLYDDSPYYPQCWNDVAARIHMTPSIVSEIRCVVDGRTDTPEVAAASIEATKLVTVSSVIRRPVLEKDTKSTK